MRVRTLLNPFSCMQRYPQQSWKDVFPHFQELLDVEIGCGNGNFIERYAREHPFHSIVGFEIRYKLAQLAQSKLEQQNLHNAHVFFGNAHWGLEDMFADNSINRLFIFHPDPWPKSNHRKRRIINETFLLLAYTKLKPGGSLYLSTDVDELWQYMTTIIKTAPFFTQSDDSDFWTNCYQTRWQEMSIEHQRTLYCGTFTACKNNIKQ